MLTKPALTALLLSTSIFATGHAAVPASAEDTQPLGIGADAPDAALRTVDDKATTLHAQLAEKPTVLVFYRGGWCPYCNAHLGELQELEPELLELGYQILALSPDRPEKLEATHDELETSYTLLSDASAEAAKAFGLAFTVDAGTIEKYKGYGIDLEDASGEDHHILPVPAAYVIGPDGSIRFAYANADYKVRVDGEQLMQAARSALERD